MRKKTNAISATAVGVLAGLACGATVQAQSADALIDKLVEKGVLTVKEANDLREETDKGFTQAYQTKSGLPDWVNGLKINGDFRGRYESFYSDNTKFIDRQRFRYRLRLGIVADMADNFEVGMRLGSGDLDDTTKITSGTDPISNNQSFQNNASKKGIFIDLAYAKWTPLDVSTAKTSFTIGKMANPFVFTDMVFDGDYTPEGAAFQSEYRFNDKHVAKLNGGIFVLDEIGSSNHDPYLSGLQGRYDAKWTSKLSSSAGVAYLGISNPEYLKSSAVPNINYGNTRTSAGSLAYQYNPLVVDATLTYNLASFPFYKGACPINIGGEYMNNTSVRVRNEAYNVGITLGKSGKKGTWDVSYRWKSLEGDAWYEEMTDSDFGAYYSASVAGSQTGTTRAGSSTGIMSGTNVRGHVIKANYSPYDNFTLGLGVLLTELIDYPAATKAVPDNRSYTTRFMVDAVFKF